ncbi:type IX secretion system membrane protein, PorP/SprF family [Marivirga sericea]|uniref:Type IX secretion system membrane protein, PorP/SprF family n=1 Tax=Marivirga sericea TaxID=1028 RepID=A0A1X7I7A9_9BACT|nr:PorP/SprF family type IX secretion system membrane protein [Marivirga sericea]SMG09953.1 type IX secretion system membrane protein, PorP/SprF family [Marivirga sericea]
MKKQILIILILSFFSGVLVAQDIPLFTQNFTNTFIYNPSFAGIDHGSITLARNQSWQDTPGAPNSNFLSINTPIPNTRFGAGFSILSENINFYNNLHMSGALAYHIPLNADNAFSFGISGELSTINVNFDNIFAEDLSESALTNLASQSTNYDFSVGSSYRSRYFLVGVSANRLISTLETERTGIDFSQFYNGYLRVLLPMRSRKDLLEPVFNYQNLASTGSQWSAGMFYTFQEIVTVGAAFRSSEVWSYSTGISINNRLALGYTYETIGNGLFSSANPTHEIVLRFDLLKTGYKYENASHIEQTKMAMALRRKTLTNNSGSPIRPNGFKRAKLRKLNPSKRYGTTGKFKIFGKKRPNGLRKSINKKKRLRKIKRRNKGFFNKR